MEEYDQLPAITPFFCKLAQGKAEVMVRMLVDHPQCPGKKTYLQSCRVECAEEAVPEEMGKLVKDLIYEYRTHYVRTN